MENKIIEKAASIARIKLTEQEINKFSMELQDILDLFSELNKVNTKNQELAVQPLNSELFLREDTEEKCLTQKQALENSKQNEDGFIKGPRTI